MAETIDGHEHRLLAGALHVGAGLPVCTTGQFAEIDIRAAMRDLAVALEWVQCQQLIKGYGDTFERGLRNFNSIRSAYSALPEERRTARWLAEARTKALVDDKGSALSAHLALAS